MFYFCSIISAEIFGVNKFGVIIPLIIKVTFTGISFLIYSRVARIWDTNLGGSEACKIKAKWSELAQSKSIYFGAVGGIFSKTIKSDILGTRNESFANTCKHWAFEPPLKQKKRGSISFLFLLWWVRRDSNPRPDRYERPALTNWATDPHCALKYITFL